MKKLTVIISCLTLFAQLCISQTQISLGQISGLPLVAPEAVPPSSTFWLWSYRTQVGNEPGIPIPWNPWGSNVSVYAFTNESAGEIQYIIDNTRIVKVQAGAQSQGLQFGAFSMSEEGSSGDGSAADTPSAISYPSNSFWISIDAVSNAMVPSGGAVFLTLHGTTEDQTYEILSRDNITNTGWLSEGTVIGASGQDWTAATVSIGARTNGLFLWARSFVDTDGDGLPDWWELANGLDPNSVDSGNTGVPDGYKDLANDGWTTIYKYEHGLDPRQAITPSSPTNVRVVYRGASTNVVVSWNAAPGAVTGYTVERRDWFSGQTYSFFPSASATLLLDSTAPTVDPTYWYGVGEYRVQAHYASLDSAWSDWVPYYPRRLFDSATLFIRGPQGLPLLAFADLPRGAETLIQTRIDNITGAVTNWTVPVSSVSNGVLVVPNDWGLNGAHAGAADWHAQFLDSSGARIEDRQVFFDAQFASPAFLDGRRQLKQNLAFLLRAPVYDEPFSFYMVYPTGSSWYLTSPDGYACASFYDPEDSYGFTEALMNETLPFQHNYIFRNFAFSTNYVDTDGLFTTGAEQYGNDIGIWYQPAYLFSAPTNGGAVAPVLSATESQWLWNYPGEGWTGINGMDEADGGGYVLSNNPANYFGLPYTSVRVGYGTAQGEQWNLLYPGGTVAQGDRFYPEVAQPNLQTIEYFFAMPYTEDLGWGDPVPGSAYFSPTNTSPLLFGQVGRTVTVAGFAKQNIVNGDAGAFAYLGQYFDKAYKMTNGIASTAETGILSPYGEFFPTEPGPTALVTMPDIDTGERGTGVVNVIKLQLDVNHDGVMDLSFGGSDNTSQSRPFLFWINNDCDWATHPGSPSFDPGQDRVVEPLYPDYYWDCRQSWPRSVRDLEDYARLWICGVPALTNASYQVTMGWANVSGSPAVNLLQSVETNGGILYLTDTNTHSLSGVPWQQIDHNSGFGNKYPVTPTNSLTLPLNWFTNAGNKCFLFEGAGAGSGELVLTISQGTNVIARTSAWLDLHDINEFYEAAVITNNYTGAVSNWTSAPMTVEYATVSDPNETQDLIVMVHGINVDYWHWADASETVVKRLYWSGYHGKFMTVKWDCDFLWKLVLGFLTTDYTVFNKSELQAYTASAGLKTYLDQLHTRFPGYRLHLLIHSQGNAVASEAIEAGATFDTYILTQAAMPTSSYDVNYTFHAGLSNAEAMYGPTPEWNLMGYRGVYTNMSGRIVNFYNPQDPVLDYWINDQGGAKPNVPGTPYTYDGTNGWFNSLFSKRLVTDAHESRAYVSRSRTLPVGQSGPATGHGVLESAVDLNAQFGFGHNFPDDHSAQWVWPIQTTRPYFQQVLRSCQIQPAQ